MIDNALLIEEVHKRPALWDQGHPHRHQREILDQLWEDVAKAFGASASPEELRKKWKGLRDTFRKELRKYPNGFEQDLSQEEFPPWVFFKPLYFLKGQMRAKRDTSIAASPFQYLMVPKEEGGDDDDDYSGTDTLAERIDLNPNGGTLLDLGDEGHHHLQAEAASRVSRTNGLVAGGRGVKRPFADDAFVDDEDYHFFLSLLPHVRRLPPARKLFVRAKIQDLVCREVYGGEGAGQQHTATQDTTEAGTMDWHKTAETN